MSPPLVLVLTPVKNATAHLGRYFELLERLSYPADRLSLGMLESDSTDGSFEALAGHCRRLESRWRRARAWQRHFGLQLPPGQPRWAHHLQIPRRTVLARGRNHLLSRALDDEDWVLWMDVDLCEYPADIIERLLAYDVDIVQPHCVLEPGGSTFDLNAWSRDGALHMDQQRDSEMVRLDAVGGTMLLVRADLHRDGLIFPPYFYGRASNTVRRRNPLLPGLSGEIETEGLGIMARDMGVQCWGLPNLEILHKKI